MAGSLSEAPTIDILVERPGDTDDGVDVTLIRWMLSLSPEERLAVLQGFTDSVLELTHDAPATKVLL
ncbi:MAG TPA: hypothetical protein VH165_33505 [Kofleriaceae bacterium]|nr:hypothetical protein [Kofleriaceae bacterium]